MKPGKVRGNDYGGVHFKFDDGTEAQADWVPNGELGDGSGGGYEEDEAYPLDSGLTPEQVVELANTNAMAANCWNPIIQPKPNLKE